MSYTRIPCPQENHQKMPMEYLCLHPTCVSQNKHLACLHCCQETHFHKDSLVTIKELITQMQQHQNKTDYNLKDILLKGLMTCQSPQELTSNLRELLTYRNQPAMFEQIFDPDMERLQKKTQQHYQRLHQRITARTLSQKSSYLGKQTITPVLSFQEGEGYTLMSPFKVTSHSQNKLVTIHAQPALSKYHDSISTTLRIDKATPNWIAIGLSIGQQGYQENSPQHLLAISNGWVSVWGTMEPTKVRFGGGDLVSLKWDKELQLLMVESRGQKETLSVKNRWKDQVYLCVCLFYGGDGVSFLG